MNSVNLSKKSSLNQNIGFQIGVKCQDLKVPRNKINVPQYRPRVPEFLSNFLPISVKSAELRKVEQSICNVLRNYLNEQLRQIHEQTWSYANTVANQLSTSKSTTVSEAITAVKTANDVAITQYITLSDKYIKEINDNCPKLGTAAAIRDVNKQVLAIRAAQLDGSFKLVEIPGKCENNMQSNYVPVEDILVTI